MHIFSVITKLLIQMLTKIHQLTKDLVREINFNKKTHLSSNRGLRDPQAIEISENKKI